jgi:hypothetical protein
MSEANSIPAASSPVGRYPDRAPGATPKPQFLDRLHEALRSRYYIRRTEETHYHISPRSSSAHLLEDGLDIRTIQEPLGHKFRKCGTKARTVPREGMKREEGPRREESR